MRDQKHQDTQPQYNVYRFLVEDDVKIAKYRPVHEQHGTDAPFSFAVLNGWGLAPPGAGTAPSQRRLARKDDRLTRSGIRATRRDAAVDHQGMDCQTPREAGVVIVRRDRMLDAGGYSNGVMRGTIRS